MRTIARELNITASSVSRALSGIKGVSEETRRRVLATARQLGYLSTYGPDHPVQVIMMVEESTLKGSSFWSQVVKGLMTEIAQYNGVLTITVTNASSPNLTLPALLQYVGKVDGVIAIRKTDYRAVQAVKRTGLPVVLLNYMTSIPGCDTVNIDDHGGTFAIATELIKLGHQHFGFVGNWTNPTFRRRYEGLVLTLIRAGIKDRLPPHWTDPMDLPSDELPTALFCRNDRIAAECVKILLSRGFRIPEDVSVVGFDDNTEEINNCPVPLTTLRVNREELGRQVVHALFLRINNPDSPPLQISVGVEPVWRQSTGRPREE